MSLVLYFHRFVVPFLRALFARSERGASLVEYVLLLMLIALVCIVSIAWFGNSNAGRANDVGTSIRDA